MPGSMFDLLSILNPTKTDLVMLFSAWNRMPPQIREVLLSCLDERVLDKMADWAVAYTTALNDIGGPVDIDAVKRIIDPTVSGDFFTVMQGTTYQGKRIMPSDLQQAMNIQTKAIKANNYLQAIKVGFSLAGFLGV